MSPDTLLAKDRLMNAVGYATAALGDLVIGLVLDATGSTAGLFLITAGACLAGAACGLAIRPPAAGRQSE